jgi:hypothetical protein
LIDFLLVVHVEQTIGFVEHEVLEALEREALGVLKMEQETTGRRADDVGLEAESVCAV